MCEFNFLTRDINNSVQHIETPIFMFHLTLLGIIKIRK